MARQGTTPHISLEHLTTTALGILQNYGLSDVSMRRVAHQLQVQPSALYWHIKDKQSLLAVVCDRILDQIAVPELTGDWRSDVRTRALRLHQGLLETRDGAELTASVVALGTGGQRLRELIAEASPEPPSLIDGVLAMLLGDALITQQRHQAEQLGILNPTGGTHFPDLLDLLLR